VEQDISSLPEDLPVKAPLGVITRPRGFRAAGVSAGIKTYAGKADVALLVPDAPASTAGVFTTNKVCAAPVKISREHLRACGRRVRAVVVNSGNANACTGKRGLRDALRMTAVTAEALHVEPHEVLVASTGVIGRPLPMRKVESGIRQAAKELSADRRGGRRFLEGIMTTDRFPKEAVETLTLSGRRVTVAGVVKGAGMIQPNMATMLGFVATDAKVSPALLQKMLAGAVDRSFNRITVDGHMSTNDTVLALASGVSGVTIRRGGREAGAFVRALDEVMLGLALQIVRDGEGAERVATVTVTGAKSKADAETAARAVANSLMVKTALFGSDPNWGRIVSAVGAADCAFVEEKTSLRIDGTFIYRRGRPLEIPKAVLKAMKGPRVRIDLDLGLGPHDAVVYTCDIGYAYVKLNAEYTT
jgi:glutamate N-acetyltransferase/amino-acid N-acetyltransferase